MHEEQHEGQEKSPCRALSRLDEVSQKLDQLIEQLKSMADAITEISEKKSS